MLTSARNLHSCLGTPYPNVTLSDFIRKKVPDIKDVIINTGIPNLRLISGAEDYLEWQIPAIPRR